MPVIKLQVNKSTELRFTGLGTAGYSWKCIIDDTAKLKAEKKMGDSLATGKNAGASNDEIFTITGLQKGTAHATFIQARPWEAESEAIKKEDYTFEVES